MIYLKQLKQCLAHSEYSLNVSFYCCLCYCWHSMVKITVETKLGNFCVTHTLSTSEPRSLDFSSEFISTTFATRGISPMSSDPIPEELLSHSLKEKGLGSPSWPSGLDSMLPMQGTWDPPLIGDLDSACHNWRSCVPQLRSIHTDK